MSDIELEFLGALEARESRLLTWGYVDGGFDLDELEALADAYVLEHDETGTLTGDDLVQRLRQRALVLDVDDGTRIQHRTRMAETVRLLARVRQLFPKHAGARWTNAPSLVADYRFLTRPRTYPRRDIEIDEAIEELSDPTGKQATRREAIQALLTNRGENGFRLSRFQVDAAREILAGLDARRSGGTIVGAGTGSGKTLAFYLPALSHIASSGGGGTRVLAIYPRIELLRDQFAEAYREARRLDGTGNLGRPVRIAALYGSTPHQPSGAVRLWKPRDEDRICPYLLCPVCGEGTLVWSRADIDAGNPRLACSNCGAAVGPDHLALTRGQIREQPPDVLFTTTEMLNRVLMDDRMRPMIGAGPRGMPIDIVLLDEVHTYEGTTGAHVAGVLRRWRHARRRPVHFVGLSATLREAPSFLASLTGLGRHQVVSVEPAEHDLEYEGQEYLLAARANPHSGASVLSATIQTALLMQRALDPIAGGPSQGAFGQRLFAFTDDLDVTNRLFFDLLDAEGLDSWGKPEKPSLAALRAPVGADVAMRRASGQTWDGLERIGHALDDSAHMRIGRTTSQDADVDRAASAIVATASLEVGFNDARVGAVLQHKAPHDAAAFLQRKGRAGRSRRMRPWTIVVLSDFGRDRATYQAYERMFDPELPPRTLPVANPAVVRMQAVFATLDWLAATVDRGAQIWSQLQRPPGSGAWAQTNAEIQLRIAEVLENVLVDPRARDELIAHLKASLSLTDNAVAEILWEPPRPLLTTALPTAIRRLRTTWNHLELGRGRDLVADGPLPEFVVSRLFGDLALPEVTVVTPAQTKHEDERREPMRAGQALNAYAPARVSHRLTIAHRYARHWVEPPPLDLDGRASMDVRSFCSQLEELGTFGSDDTGRRRVLRPLEIEVTVPPADVLSSSHGRLQWNAELLPSAASEQVLAPPAASPLADLVRQVAFHTHGGLAHVEVRRWAVASEIETLTSSTITRGSVHFVDSEADGDAVGLGFAIDVDALAVDLDVPPALITGRDVSAVHLRGLRVERWREQLADAPALQRALGTFDIARLAEAVLLALVREAITTEVDLESAYQSFAERDELASAATSIIRRRWAKASDEADDQTRAHAVIEALEQPDVLDAIAHAVPALWERPDVGWDAWAELRLATTVAAAFHAALQDLCPEYDGEDVVVDVVRGDDGARKVWLSEQTVGGGGLLQEALRRIGDHPRRFFDLVAAAAEPSLDETVDVELSRIVRAATADAALIDALERVRRATGHSDRVDAFDSLLAILERGGALISHAVVAAVSVRLLRPGSTSRVDEALLALLDRWEHAEQSLGTDLELSLFAELESPSDSFDRASGLSAPSENPEAWRIGQISGLLWPRGAAVRQQALRAPNPFQALPSPDPLLLRESLGERGTSVNVEHLVEALSTDGPLARYGDVELLANAQEASRLRRGLLEAAATAIEAGPLLHYPRVDGIRRGPEGLRARLVLDLVGE